MKPDDDENTGLPGLRSWRSVYWFVFGCFVLFVIALTLFSRYFG
jgi:Mg2+ and Co2+ transporter CorA